MPLVCALLVAFSAPFSMDYGRYTDRTARWQSVVGDLIHGVRNMYNFEIVHTPDDADYPYKAWFFGWIQEDCNPGYPGCDAVCMARARRVEGPWEVYAGEHDGQPKWDAAMSPATWQPVLAGGGQYFNNWHTGDPTVVLHEGRYYLAYSSTGFNTDGIPYGQEGDTDSDISCIMGATSDDGIHWTLSDAPILVDARNIGQSPVEPGGYQHPTGLYHRPSLLHEGDCWKLWFDASDAGKPCSTFYAENRGDFMNPADWHILRGHDKPCIVEWPNPDVVKVGDLYFGFADPGGHPETGWARRKTSEAVSLDGRNWMIIGYMEPDSDAQANHVPQGYYEDGWLYVTYGAQQPGDFRYPQIRMKKRQVTEAECAFWRARLAELPEAPATYAPHE